MKKKSATSSRVTCQSNKWSSPSTRPRFLSQLPPISLAQSPAGNPPPPIHPSESSLSRKVRTGLARLRSGYSRMLKSYLHILDETVADSCPDCNSAGHTAHHLFKCPAVRPPSPPWTYGTTPQKWPVFWTWKGKKKCEWPLPPLYEANNNNNNTTTSATLTRPAWWTCSTGPSILCCQRWGGFPDGADPRLQAGFLSLMVFSVFPAHNHDIRLGWAYWYQIGWIGYFGLIIIHCSRAAWHLSCKGVRGKEEMIC